MAFNTATFVVFLFSVLALYYLASTWKLRKVVLLVASYLFYAAWDPPFIALLWVETVVSYVLANAIFKTKKKHKRKRKLLLTTSILFNLTLLCYFKYSRLLLETFSDFIGLFGLEYVPPDSKLILPLGISFFTFQTMSYAVDVYRKAAKPAGSFFDYCLYVSFFPQLVAGPIVRAAELLPQITQPPEKPSASLPGGLTMVMMGLFAKAVIADTFFAQIVNPAFKNTATMGLFDAWATASLFTGQVFFDFSGYTLLALGSAQCLGFKLPRNFNLPFGAVGFTDFWNRWHISLTTWIRDYVYFPLSISTLKKVRKILPRHIYDRIMFMVSVYVVIVTMFLAGLWHGASWTMAVMGLTFGGLLMLEHVIRAFIKGSPGRFGTPIVAVLTFLAICIPMAMFRSPTMTALGEMVSTMLAGSLTFEREMTSHEATALAILVATIAIHITFRKKGFVALVESIPRPFRLALYIAILISLIVVDQPGVGFIYFAF